MAMGTFVLIIFVGGIGAYVRLPQPLGRGLLACATGLLVMWAGFSFALIVDYGNLQALNFAGFCTFVASLGTYALLTRVDSVVMVPDSRKAPPPAPHEPAKLGG